MKELERLTEIHGEIANIANNAVIFGWIVVIICTVGSIMCFRETYLLWKWQKEIKHKYEERIKQINNKYGSCFFYSSNQQKR